MSYVEGEKLPSKSDGGSSGGSSGGGGGTENTVVTLDTSDGSKLGIKLMKDPASGCGALVKSCDPGGLAEAAG